MTSDDEPHGQRRPATASLEGGPCGAFLRSGSFGITIKHSSDEGQKSLPARDGLNNRLPENWADSGVNGVRGFGFDFSGRSGAPCLMVVVDRITGGRKKVWTWHVEREGAGAKSEKGEVTIDGNSFTLKRGDAFLRATFVSPGKVKIVRHREEVKMRSGASNTSRAFEGFLDRIEAVGDVPTSGEFFVVVTVQRKDAPEVKAEGAGADARVTVGAQKIRFDGNVVRIE